MSIALFPMVIVCLISAAVVVGIQAVARRQAQGFSAPGTDPRFVSPPSEGKGWQALTCIAIGAVVPICCFGFAVNLVRAIHKPRVDSELMFLFALIFVVIGVGSLISGSILANRLLGSRNQGDRLLADKPPFHAEALDVVEAYDVARRHD